jgi:hypothetical protein
MASLSLVISKLHQAFTTKQDSKPQPISMPFKKRRARSFKARIVIRFDKKTGKFETKTFRNFDVDFEAFCGGPYHH